MLREHYGTGCLLTLLAVSLTLNVMAAVAEPTEPIAFAGFREESLFPLLTGLHRDGNKASLDFRTPTVVYVFSPNCGWCEADQPNLKALARSQSTRFAFVGLTLLGAAAPTKQKDRLAQYLREHPFPGQVILIDPETLSPQAMRDLRVTPQTIVIKPGGRIEKAWVGALLDRNKNLAERFFGLTLPGVTELPQ